MSLDPRKARLVFRQAGKQLEQVSRRVSAEHVHHFRTAVRRVEALLLAAGTPGSARETRLLRDLGRLRRRAGKMRDLDVQMDALAGLQIGRDGRQKQDLLDILETRRSAARKALESALAGKSSGQLARRIRKQAERFDPQPLALHLPALPAVPLRAGNLHEFRKACKQIRYLAELYPAKSAMAAAASRLKTIQDAIGEWHDWAELTRRAEKYTPAATDSPLFAALRNITQAKLQQALRVADEQRGLLQTAAAPPRRPPQRSAGPAAVPQRAQQSA